MKMNKIKQISLIILLLMIGGKLVGQDLSVGDVEHMFDRFKKKPFKFTGGISANQVFYGADGIDNRRSPYTYYLSGNLNVAFYGWNFPFTFSFSDQENQYQTPPFQSYDRYGMTPYYKWIKLHGGYSSMTFSPYTYNGYTFLGGGAELTPGIFNISAFYGRLHEAIEEDTSENITPVYKRMGYGFKFGVKKESDYVDVMFFKAEDDAYSLENVSEESEIKPGENLVVGIKGGKMILKKIKLEAEYASTAITRDVRAEKQTEDVPFLFANLKGLFSPTVSSEYYNAYKTSLNYSGGSYGVGLAYEHIDPGYETMGAYYFNNDLEKITVNGNTSLLKQKMQLAVNVGFERNNLDDDKLSTMKKTVGSVNMNYSPSAKWNFAASFSNFTSFTNIRPLYDTTIYNQNVERIDTLNFTQLTQSANANVSYLIGDPADADKKQFLNLNASAQLAANEQQGNPNSGSSFYNGNISYTISLVPKNMSITVAATGNYTEMPNAYTAMVGPMASISRVFFEKTLRTTASIAWNQAYVNEELTSSIINFRLNASYNIKKKHNLNLSLVALNKTETTEGHPDFTEYTVTLGYSYSFATKDERKKKKNESKKEEN